MIFFVLIGMVMVACAVLFFFLVKTRIETKKKDRSSLEQFCSNTSGITGGFLAMMIALVGFLYQEHAREEEQIQFVKHASEAMLDEIRDHAVAATFLFKHAATKGIDLVADRQGRRYEVAKKIRMDFPILESLRPRFFELPTAQRQVLSHHYKRARDTLFDTQNLDTSDPNDEVKALAEARDAAVTFWVAMRNANSKSALTVSQAIQAIEDQLISEGQLPNDPIDIAFREFDRQIQAIKTGDASEERDIQFRDAVLNLQNELAKFKKQK